MAKQIIDLTGIGGMSPNYRGNLSSSTEDFNLVTQGQSNQIAAGIANPLRIVGHIGPGNDTVTARLSSGFGSAHSRTMVYDSSANAVWFLSYENPSQLYRAVSATPYQIDSYRTLPANAVGTDATFYMVNGTRKLFYAYRTLTGGNIGISDTVSTNNDTWLSGTVSGAFTAGANELRLIPADNGFLYVLDGSAIHKIDGGISGGTNGTVSPNVLLLPAGYYFVDGMDFRGKLWTVVMGIVGTSFNPFSSSLNSLPNFCGVSVWDRNTAITSTSDFIQVPGAQKVITIFNYESIPYIFTIGANGFAELRQFNGKHFDVIKTLGHSAQPHYPSGVTVSNNGFYWLGDDGIVYFYGKAIAGSSNQLYKLGNISANATDYNQSGAILEHVRTVTGNPTGTNSTPPQLYVSYKGSANSYISSWFPFAGDAETGTDIPPSTQTAYSMVLAIPKLSTLKSLTLHYPPISGASGNNLNLSLFLNRASTAVAMWTLDATDAARSWKYIPVGRPNVNYVQLGLQWQTAPSTLVKSITPEYCEVEIEETGKKL